MAAGIRTGCAIHRLRGHSKTRHLLLLVVFVLCFVALVQAAQAQTANPAPIPTERNRPRIGLVLSGGGARGIAHVGVLRWLEQHRIPVDLVAGTSMGGVVGGLYAAGVAPDDLLTLVQSADWNQALSGVPPYTDLSFRRKEDRRAVPSDIEFGRKNGTLRGRSGLNPGHEIGLIFNRATLPYGDNIRFDDLTIPFKCVATDMVAAQPVVLEDGSLSSALRATMSIPGIFTLVRRNGKLLSDGGLMDNIPTDVAQRMGAQIIIAVNVSETLSDETALSNIGGVLQQTILVMAAEGRRRSLAQATVALTPDLNGFGSFDFERAEGLVKRGYEVAEKNAAALEKYALPEDQWRQYLAARLARRPILVPIPTFISVSGATRNGEPLVRERLKHFIGKPIDIGKLENELNQLRAQSGYDTVSYEITKRSSDSAPGLLIHVLQKPYDAPFLYPALTVEGNSQQNQNDLAVISRVVWPNLDTNGSEARVDFGLGSFQRLTGEYYRPVRKGDRRFIATRVSLEQNPVDYYETGSRLAQYRLQREAVSLDTGYTFLQSEIRASYEIANLSASIRVGNPDLPTLRGTEQSAQLRYTFDAQNSATIPTQGLRVQGRMGYFLESPGVSQGFPQAEVQSTYFIPVNLLSSFFVLGSGGTSFGKKPSAFQQFYLGGPFRLSAYSQNSLRGERYILLGSCDRETGENENTRKHDSDTVANSRYPAVSRRTSVMEIASGRRYADFSVWRKTSDHNTEG
jgi:NTE family protein